MDSLIDQNALDVFHHILIADPGSLALVLGDGRLLARQRVLQQRLDGEWLPVIGRRPVHHVTAFLVPQARIGAKLEGQATKNLQMVHFHDADVMKGFSDLLVRAGD